MTPEDRDLLAALRAEEVDLRQALSRLESRLGDLESRAFANGHAVALPPVPAAELPPVPLLVPPAVLPPLPVPDLPPVPQARAEFNMARWLSRLGALFIVLALISLDGYFHLHRFLGRAGQLALMGVISVALVALGRRLRAKGMKAYGHTVAAAGLGALYVTLYAATAVAPWQLLTNPVAGGLVLLLWSLYVFDLARRSHSQALALVALVLAYVTTSLNPSTRFCLGADLLLAGTAVIFLLRSGWLLLASVSLGWTYLVMGRRLLFDQEGAFTFDTSRALAFAPHAVYLVAAWGAFTAGILLAPRLRRSARLAFLSTNNALAAGLLVLSAIICGYGSDRTGWVLLLSGAALLGAGAMARLVRTELAGACSAQGLALLTGGVMVLFGGATRGVLLLAETLLLVVGAVVSGSRILGVCAWVVATFATAFVLWDVTVETRDPWVLGLGGAAVLLKSAWLTRRRQAEPILAWPATLYCALGLALLGSLLATQLEPGRLPPVLAFAGLAATGLGFALRLGELAPVAQVLVLAAQGLALFPCEDGELVPVWSGVWVMLVTLATMLTIRRSWLRLLDPLYALALVGLIDHLVRPDLGAPAWIILACALSCAFLFLGAAGRIGSLAAAGQLFLLAAVIHFFRDVGTMPWTAAIPLCVVFATGRALHAWLQATPEFTGTVRHLLRAAAFGYQLLALLMLIDGIVALAPVRALASIFLLLGALLVTINVLRQKTFGLRCAFVCSGLGAVLVLFTPGPVSLNFAGVLAVLSFLTQPLLLAHSPRRLVTKAESRFLVVVSSLTGWVCFSSVAAAHWGPGGITAGWAIYALLLFLAGFVAHESWPRWCGLAILLAAVARVFTVDFFHLGAGFRVLTFVVLAVVTLGLGFLYARYPQRFRTWI